MPEPIILDASAWLAILLNEEGTDRIAGLIEKFPLLSPELVRYETANGVLRAARSGRIKGRSLNDLFHVVREFPIQIVPISVWWAESARLVQKHSLTFYDAAYLGAAAALKAPLLTLDQKIIKVTESEGLEIAS